jgi:hypothetical protein
MDPARGQAHQDSKRTTKLFVKLGLPLVVLAGIVAYLVWSGGEGPRIYPPGSRPHGKTYEEWSALHWQWVCAIPASENPRFGNRCPDMGQSGEVWFLAATTAGTVVRECSVPAGKAILITVVNVFVWNSPGESFTEQELRERGAEDLRHVSEMGCTIDGTVIEDLDRFRVQSPVFDLHLAADNFLTEIPGDYDTVVSDGWWIMLEPLPKGEHVIHTWRVDRSGTGQRIGGYDVTYHLTVR